MSKKRLTFEELRVKNYRRCDGSFNHSVEEWSESDWACALAGEVGEFCNFVKKRKRIFDEYNAGKITKRKAESRLRHYYSEAGKELADIMMYLDLNASKLGFKLQDLVIDKFNEVSKRKGSKLRL